MTKVCFLSCTYCVELVYCMNVRERRLTDWLRMERMERMERGRVASKWEKGSAVGPGWETETALAEKQEQAEIDRNRSKFRNRLKVRRSNKLSRLVQTTWYLSLLRRSRCQNWWLQCHKFLPWIGRKTWQATRRSLTNCSPPTLTTCGM